MTSTVAYVKMQLIRWRRRTFGIGLLVASVFLSATFSLMGFADWLVSGDRLLPRNIDVLVLGGVCVPLVLGSTLATVNQLGALIAEEGRLRRTGLLRTSGLEGPPALSAFAALGSVLCGLSVLAGFPIPVALGLLAGLPLGTWAVPVTMTTLILPLFVPPAIVVAFALPRTLAVFVLNAGALVGSPLAILFAMSWVQSPVLGPVVVVSGLEAATLVAGALLWKWKGPDLW